MQEIKRISRQSFTLATSILCQTKYCDTETHWRSLGRCTGIRPKQEISYSGSLRCRDNPVLKESIGVRGGVPPWNLFNSYFWAKKHVIFRQNHLIFRQAMETIFGQLTSAPLNETGPVRLWRRGWWRKIMDLHGCLQRLKKNSSSFLGTDVSKGLARRPRLWNILALLSMRRQTWAWKGTGVHISNRYTLLKSDVTRHDHVSVAMDAGSRIVNFIRDSTVFA